AVRARRRRQHLPSLSRVGPTPCLVSGRGGAPPPGEGRHGPLLLPVDSRGPAYPLRRAAPPGGSAVPRRGRGSLRNGPDLGPGRPGGGVADREDRPRAVKWKGPGSAPGSCPAAGVSDAQPARRGLLSSRVRSRAISLG